VRNLKNGEKTVLIAGQLSFRNTTQHVFVTVVFILIFWCSNKANVSFEASHVRRSDNSANNSGPGVSPARDRSQAPVHLLDDKPLPHCL